MVVAWPVGVQSAFVADTYQRIPEDVVVRTAVEAGPPLRHLRAASRAHTVRGEIPCSLSEAAVFETWRKDELIHQRDPFTLTLYDHPAPRSLSARFIAPVQNRARSQSRRRLALEVRTDPPAPNPGTLVVLAALHKAAPADWPAGVPGCPRVSAYQGEIQSTVGLSELRNSPGATLSTHMAGNIESVVSLMTSAQLETFETWFETDAAFGVRDISFPVPGGTALGCFQTSYTVSGAGDQAGWLISYQRYLEARP